MKFPRSLIAAKEAQVDSRCPERLERKHRMYLLFKHVKEFS